MQQPFASLDQMVRQLRVLLPAPKETWRLVADPVCGQINGLDRFRGTAIATNGIMVLLINEVDIVTIGHLQWFVPDPKEQNAEMSDLWDGALVRPTKPNKKLKHMEFYLDI